MRKSILEALREADGYLSGQELSERFDVSRTAIWKKIRQLQDEGYQIKAVSKRGYRLVASPDSVSEEELSSLMKTGWAGKTVRYYPSVTSTNQIAKQLAEEGAPEGTLVVTDEQTAGKGRSGRVWETPRGETIAMTLILRPALPPERISMVTLVAGMAVAEGIRKLSGLDDGIKWPNDVVVGGKKISGILTEMTTDMESVGYIVVGIGINTGVTSFPEELADKATSLYIEGARAANARSVRRSELIAEIMSRFEDLYARFLERGDMSGLRDAYEELLVNCGRSVRVMTPGAEFEGTAEGITEMGELLVRREDGTVEKIYAGEVSVRGMLGYV